MDDFTSAFLNRGKGELRDLENTVSFTPFGVTPPAAVGNPQLTTADTALASECTGEPESIRIWRKEFNESIEKRDFNESKKQALLQETAKKEIQDWEAWHQKNTLKSRQQNRMHEEELHAARDKVTLLSASLAKVDPSDVAIWERICQLCDLAGNSGDWSASGSGSISLNRTSTTQYSQNPPKDITRFRSLLMSLRKDPPKLLRQ
ncbi:hypothetical protein AAHC03_016737 [Spirometra sp. Aus1]